MKNTILSILGIAMTCAMTGLVAPQVSNASIFDNPSVCETTQAGVAADILILHDLTLANGAIFVASPKVGDVAAKLAVKLYEDRSALNQPDRGAAPKVLQGKYAEAIVKLQAYITELDKAKVVPGAEGTKRFLRDAAVKLIGCVNNLAMASAT